MTRWKCGKCSYIYDPRVGDPDGGIPPGTPLEQIPRDWRCPICGATKEDFYVIAGGRTALPVAVPASSTAPAGSATPTPAATPPPALPAPLLEPIGWTVGRLRGKPQGTT